MVQQQKEIVDEAVNELNQGVWLTFSRHFDTKRSRKMSELLKEDDEEIGHKWRGGILAKAKGDGTQKIRGLWLVQGEMESLGLRLQR